MKLSVARELKEALKAKVQRTALGAGPSLEAFAAGRSAINPAGLPRNFRMRTHVAEAAVGVAPVPGRAKDYRVALRTAGALRAADLLSGMRAGDDEVDVVERIRFTPRGGRRASTGATGGSSSARRQPSLPSTAARRAGGTASADAAPPRSVPRPAGEVYPGGSCGHYAITAGTLGGFVEDAARYYILSNNHVLADSDRGVRGDPILEPGPVDIIAGDSRVIGTLEKWVPLRGGLVDAALAVFHEDIRFFYPRTYQGIGEIDPRVVADRYDVRRVTKLGRTTGVTAGTVSAFELDDVTINYGSETRPYVVRFDNQIECVGAPPEEPFSQPGDSGSFIFDAETLRPYAVLFGGGAGADGIDRTLANFMPDVLAQLNVRLVDS